MPKGMTAVAGYMYVRLGQVAGCRAIKSDRPVAAAPSLGGRCKLPAATKQMNVFRSNRAQGILRGKKNYFFAKH